MKTLSPYQLLDPREQAIVTVMIEACVNCVKEYARLMESGEIRMRSGPDALYHAAEAISVVMRSFGDGKRL
jgi:hypothetical protein